MIRALLILGLVLAAAAVRAQVPASLVADRIVVTNEGALIAAGNVEVYYDGTRLTADRVVYDEASDRLRIEGPILVITADGAIFSADQAALDPRLETGILLGARLVLNRQLQLAAGQIDRTEGRYSTLRDVAVTSCRVCSGRAPLWEIRAAQVTHDEAERQLYFDNAQLRVGGLPILWLPRMRLPDPTLDRATGFLIPSIRSTNQLGIGLRLPYFIRLGDARDLTLTPYLSSQTRTVELRYRQAYGTGQIQFDGALTDDTLVPDEIRGYATLTGAFGLSGGYVLSFDLEGVSDRAYLLDYGLSDTDVLESEIALLRVRDQDYMRGALTVFESLREGDDNDLLPGVVSELQYERRLTPATGGTLTISTGFDSLYRAEEADGIGRDLGRAGAALDWRQSWVMGPGLVTEAQAMAGFDLFNVGQDPDFVEYGQRGTYGAGLTLRWPFAGQDASGATHLVEPIAHIAWSDVSGDSLPNEDSTVAEFDEGNLLSLSRFAGEDVVEEGLRGAVGLSWTRAGPLGWQSTLSFGRVFRDEAAGFAQSSGLSGAQSDWLISGQLQVGDALGFGVRALLDDTGDFTKTEARLDWASDRSALSAAYVFLPADLEEARDEAVSEWTFDGAYQINEAWALTGEARYDLVADSPAKAALGVDWRNECVEVGLRVSRRFTSSVNVEPTTDYSLSVELLGFSARDVGPARSCGG